MAGSLGYWLDEMYFLLKYHINPLLRACGDAMDNLFHISIILSVIVMLYLLTTCVYKEGDARH